jgi:hypothetical protein
MATVLEVCTIEELCSIVHFLWAKGLNAKDTRKEFLSCLRWEVFVTYSGSQLGR